MRYQLVLQLPAFNIKDYDSMVNLEEVMINGIGELGLVDGHDAGLNEMNIFILTNQPQAVFSEIMKIIGSRDFMPDLKVAYREIGKDEFVILYPIGLERFAIA